MRFIARFAQELPDHFEIIDVFDTKIEKTPIDKDNPEIETVAHIYPAAVWFERKIHDDFGIKILHTFDNRPLIHHERFPNIHPMRKDFTQKSIEQVPFHPYHYEVIEGDGIFQVGVGPVHAGIIEPGHFHFSQEGEAILHLEVRHFYKYRGIEKIVEKKHPNEVWNIIERISGNESIAYQLAYLELLIQASNQKHNENIQKYGAILLELERIAHHLVDLGFIPNDAGFGAALAYSSMLAEDTRRALKTLTNHRFGFGAIRGKAKKIDQNILESFLNDLESKIDFFENWIIEIPSLWDRLDTTGKLSPKKALKYSTVGVVARASGVRIDRRENSFYKKHGFSIQTQQSGDVAARFKVRLQEVKNSIQIIRNLLDFQEDSISLNAFEDGEYFSFIESSLGEVMLYLKIKDQKIDRFFARDPSFINWQALHLMMPGNIIADFPLTNKSCDLSYAGSDL
ncbi:MULTISPECIES: NADH-quinone oxidoreductase subunit C [unclassified Nitratiruptor]|uniref:hydrogenase large subunit n=1 Tax=unclassified Nitratiruptor TaxID=2624044 RepID=UPI00191555BD|nr:MULTISPECIES: NADH-quinone oxidoreductase subunit C [unclassified Nitratiruptor]BCD60018.1 formate hydrogenlyase subunit 5 [Nitratiruptor sp. YY08-10]BCD63941.1 formate hydrogenlyase subunit 5 [Nitratiruptor sp. YY08-14]